MFTKLLSRVLCLIVAAALLAGCASTQSTVSGDNRAAARVFLISSEQAEKILATAMTAQFPGTAISRVEFPNKGYQATVRFLLDSHTIAAYIIAARGRSADGAVKDGFAFEVSNAGTMPLSGGTRASNLFDRLVRDASALSPPVPLAGF